jgi:hypothetical protein
MNTVLIKHTHTHKLIHCACTHACTECGRLKHIHAHTYSYIRTCIHAGIGGVSKIRSLPRDLNRAFSGGCAKYHDRPTIAGLIKCHVHARVPVCA